MNELVEIYTKSKTFDNADEIVNETGLQIGLVFLSDLTDGTVYIEWLEIMACFRGIPLSGKNPDENP